MVRAEVKCCLAFSGPTGQSGDFVLCLRARGLWAVSMDIVMYSSEVSTQVGKQYHENWRVDSECTQTVCRRGLVHKDSREVMLLFGN